MGLLDILNSVPAGGVSNDPRARAAPPSQGMSPTAKALLALLAIYAMKNLRRADAPPTQPAMQPAPFAPAAAPVPAVEQPAAPPPQRPSILRRPLTSEPLGPNNPAPQPSRYR